jgi:hypothetical protein
MRAHTKKGVNTNRRLAMFTKATSVLAIIVGTALGAMAACTSAVSALARDSAEMLRDRRIICNQFVIEDPYPVIVGDSAQYCCRPTDRTRDCRADNPHEDHH